MRYDALFLKPTWTVQGQSGLEVACWDEEEVRRVREVTRVFDRNDTTALDGSPALTQGGQRSDGSRHRYHLVIGTGRHCGTLNLAGHSYKNAGDLE